jgi:protein phosphatase
VHVDLEGPFSAQSGDKFLICSDGLSGPVNDEEIGTLLGCLEPKDAADTLVDLANLRGGPDNISVVVAQVNGAIPQTGALENCGDSVPHNRPPSALLWIAAGVFLAILGYCLAYHYWAGAIGSAVGSVAAIVAALAFRPAAKVVCPPIGPIGGPYGNGPYRKAHCKPNGKMLTTLAEFAAKLRDMPNQETSNGSINWKSFDAARSEAKAAAERDDLVVAVREYSAAIRDVMKQLRATRPTVDSPPDRP